jgi:hypothetical protein
VWANLGADALAEKIAHAILTATGEDHGIDGVLDNDARPHQNPFADSSDGEPFMDAFEL